MQAMRTLEAPLPLLLALALAAPLVARAAPPAAVQQEVTHLLEYIAQSGCSFYRNGSWNDAKAAQGHVRMKYDNLAAQGKIVTAKDFIDKAASESSFTGSPYQIRCGANPPVLSRAWLSEELARYQAAASSAATPSR
jgi:hypothetical protein